MKKGKKKQPTPDHTLRDQRREMVRALRIHDREVVVQADGTRKVTRPSATAQGSLAQEFVALRNVLLWHKKLDYPRVKGKQGGDKKEKNRVKADPVPGRIRKAVRKMRAEKRMPGYMDLELMPKYGPMSRWKMSKKDLKKLIRDTVKAWDKKKKLL